MEIQELERDIKNTRLQFDKTLEINGFSWVQNMMLHSYINQLEELHYKRGVQTYAGDTTYS
jgi:hypothetical protein